MKEKIAKVQVPLVLVLVGVFALILAVTIDEAETKNDDNPEIVKIVGMLHVSRDDKRKKTAINVVDYAGEVYHVVPDKKSKKMAKKHDGKVLKVTGTVDRKLSDLGDGMWIKVRKFKVADHHEEDDRE